MTEPASRPLPAPRPLRFALALVLGPVLMGLTGCAGVLTGKPAPKTAAVCHAGPYLCELATQAPVGAQCTCPGIGAPVFGKVR